MAEGAIIETAPAKINLDLLVLGRRQDGYHELDSLVVFTEPADRLKIEASDRLALEVDGPFADRLPAIEETSVLRAARHLQKEAAAPLGARLRLTKNLPVAAGIGGGSSDAAAALRGLDRLWRLDLGDERLRAIGLELGADVPACLHARPLRMRGVGDRLDPVRGLPELPLLLVNPGLPLATADVFRTMDRDGPAKARRSWPRNASLPMLALWLRASRNDLALPAVRLVPEIAVILKALEDEKDVLLARMSGSGPTCFGIFRSEAAAAAARDRLAARHSEWWVALGLVEGG